MHDHFHQGRDKQRLSSVVCLGGRGEHLQNASIIHLTEKDFEQHPTLDAVIRGEERNPSAWEWGYRDQRVIGGTNVSYAESKALHDTYGPGGEHGLYPLLEYEGAYYVVLTTWP